jgi:hypothetical protein
MSTTLENRDIGITSQGIHVVAKPIGPMCNLNEEKKARAEYAHKKAMSD